MKRSTSLSGQNDTYVRQEMLSKECKRLAEVDFPIAVVSKHAAREKSIRHGHPSTLHLWWARRPLAACRAILLALLWPDPCDPNCPEEFKQKARKLLPTVQGEIGDGDPDLRNALLKFIGDFANWDLSTNPNYLEVSRALVKAAQGDEPPLVVDPFAGGGSIPLEALRLGCDAFASDLNPVACLILKSILQEIPHYGYELAKELRHTGDEIKREAERWLGDLYPQEADRSKPIAYIWARTVRCESPNCGAEIPVFRSPWLCKRSSSRARYFKEDNTGSCVVILIQNAPLGGPVKFRIARGQGSEHPLQGFELVSGTKLPGNNSNVRCPCCGGVLSGAKTNPRVQIQLTAQKGGARVIYDANGNRTGGAYILAVVTTADTKRRRYRLATSSDYQALWKAKRRLNTFLARDSDRRTAPVPDEAFHGVRPSPNSRGLSAVTRYGIARFSDLYNERQLLALVTLAGLIRERATPTSNCHFLAAVSNLLALCLGRISDYCSAQSRWDSTQERNVNAFGRQALPMLWDYAELVPIADCVGSWDSMLNGIIRVVERTALIGREAVTDNADATDHPMPSESAECLFTDPPYYDSVPYADLADFFYVWLKRVRPDEPLLRNRFEEREPLTPKLRECVWNAAYTVNGTKKDPQFFEQCVSRAFGEARRIIKNNGVATIVFAHKSTEGWEALLSGLIRSRWVVVTSWPIATEQQQRLVARDSAALATSVHLVCRPRPDDAHVGDWGEALRELPNRVGDWMERLQSEGVRGADLVFACIGPALEIFSRYSRVETAEGREVKLAEYLEKVWEVVGRAALEQVLGTAEARARNGAAGALEEDARLTALFLWTLQSTNGTPEETATNESEEEDLADEEDEEETTSRASSKGYSLVFDVVRRFAQPLGIALPKWDGRIIETKKGVVRLLPVTERSRQLFGEEGTHVIAEQLERSRGKETPQLKLFGGLEDGQAPRRRSGRQNRARTASGVSGPIAGATLDNHPDATTLDRVHIAMLLQANGRTNALRALLKAEQDRSPDFLRLANALSALYPRNSEEKRLLDAMLLAAPR